MPKRKTEVKKDLPKLSLEIEGDLEVRLKSHYLTDLIPLLFESGYRTTATVKSLTEE
jgi:hypothetical protein